MYFTIEKYINYFIIVDKKKEKVSEIAKDFALLIEPEKKLFVKLEKNYSNIKNNIKKQASIVYNFRNS